MTARERFEVQTQYCDIMLLVFHGLAVNRYKYGEKQYAQGRKKKYVLENDFVQNS